MAVREHFSAAAPHTRHIYIEGVADISESALVQFFQDFDGLEQVKFIGKGGLLVDFFSRNAATRANERIGKDGVCGSSVRATFVRVISLHDNLLIDYRVHQASIYGLGLYQKMCQKQW